MAVTCLMSSWIATSRIAPEVGRHRELVCLILRKRNDGGVNTSREPPHGRGCKPRVKAWDHMSNRLRSLKHAKLLKLKGKPTNRTNHSILYTLTKEDLIV